MLGVKLNWRISFHNKDLKTFQIHIFPELHFSYDVVNGRAIVKPIIYEEEVDSEGCYIRLLEEDSFYKDVQHTLDSHFNCIISN